MEYMQTTQLIRGAVSPRTERNIRVAAIIAMLVVALSSAILSFDGLQSLALESQVPAHLAFLFPIAVDTTILMGSLAVLLYEIFGLRAVFGWFTVLFGTALSVVGNVISVADAGIIAQVLHGIIPILLCISLESLLRILRFNIRRTVATKEPSFEDDYSENNVAKATVAAPLVSVEPTSLKKAEEDSADSISTPEQDNIRETDRDTNSENSAPVFLDTNLTSEQKVVEPVENEVPSIEVNEFQRTDERVSATQSSTLAEVADSNKTESTSQSEPPVEDNLPAQKSPNLEPTVEAKPVSSVPLQAQAPKPKKKSSGVGHPPLDEAEKAEFKALIDSFPEEYPAFKKLGEVMRFKKEISAADIRYIMSYPEDKRVDAITKKARDFAGVSG